MMAPTPAFAGEGGGSHYLPGSMGDFAMALIGPPGFYLRNDLVYFEGDIGPVTLGDRVYAAASQDAWVDTVKGIWLGEGGPFGGRLGAVVSLPIVVDATAAGTLAFPPVAQSGSRSGIGDLTLSALLNWKNHNQSWSAGLNVFVPVGSYDEDRIINLGRNYWSFDTVFTYTWLHPERGHELSFATGLMFNTENEATGYRSGTEWHMDFMLAQHLSKTLAFGLEGSLLRGVEDDDGPLLDRANSALPALGLRPLGGFRAEYFGVGPAVLYASRLGGRDVNFIGKYLVDVAHENRFDSDYVMVSVAFRWR